MHLHSGCIMVELVEASQKESNNHEGEMSHIGGNNMLRHNHLGHFNRGPNFEHGHYNHNGPRIMMIGCPRRR